VLRLRSSVLLAALSCVALAGCGSPSRSTVSSLSGVSRSSIASSTSDANGGSAAARSALPCGDDRESGRVVAVYRAMLAGPDDYPGALSATHLYVATTLTDGGGLGASAGVMSEAVRRCLSGGVAGIPPITFVYGRDDPSIPSQPSGIGPLSRFSGNVLFVGFGDVVAAGSKVTSSVVIDAGGGDVGGAEFVLQVDDTGATIVATTSRWSS
jgi:hypothetical protein